MSAEAALKEAEQKLAEMNKMRQKEIDKAKSEATDNRKGEKGSRKPCCRA